MPTTDNPLPQLILQRLIKAKQRVEEAQWSASTPLAVHSAPANAAPITLAAAQKQTFSPLAPGTVIAPGSSWGDRWSHLDLPRAAAGERGRRHLRWDCQGETTAWIDGAPWAGLDVAHPTCPLPDRAGRVWLQTCLWQTGVWTGRPIDRFGPRFDGAALGLRDADAWGALWDLDALLQVLLHQFKDAGINPTFGHQAPHERLSPLTRRLLRACDDAVDVLDGIGAAEGKGGIAALRRALAGVFAEFKAEAWQPGAALSGHAHIDLVWLWPESATELKGIHTFATQLRLLERYPEFRFTQSQPALYRAIERLAPAQMQQIGAQIRAGRWEATGALEVELDTQLPCGESVVRSLVYGQRAFSALRGGGTLSGKGKNKPGTPSNVCWIPDVFGYSASLPQILRLGGVDNFFTTKMTWSMVTRFPYSSFVWRGADGSEVLTHLCSTGYNGDAKVDDLSTALKDHRQADVHHEMLLPQGYGDGGGGVTEEVCERARRLADLAGVPRAKWTTVEDFFTRLQRQRARLPTYQGELYLEYHRGTYTTQSEFKRLHRAAERALQAREAVRAARGGAPLGEQPWLRLLFSQFHDAIPGSSIALVYEQLNAELAAIAVRELDAATGELATTPLTWFNPLAVPRTVLVELPAGAPADALGAATVQRNGRGRDATVLAQVALPGLGSAGLSTAAPAPLRATPRLLDNGIVRAEFARGRLSALRVNGTDLELAGAPGFTLHHDVPAKYDAWDIDHYSLKHGTAVPAPKTLELVESGSLRAVLRGKIALSPRSSLVVDHILEAGSRWLRVVVAIEWHEDHRLLKYHVPTAYRGRWARFGGPFGSIQRPQLPGVAADEAMWEVPAGRWAAVTHEDGAGLAIVSEAKYGFSCRDGVLGLSLLRAPTNPDPRADRGAHRIAFALGRHEPRSADGSDATALAAETLYAPVLAGGTPDAPPFRLADLGSLVPSWVLPAETGTGYVIRLHETTGAAGRARLHLAKPARSVRAVDLLERPLTEAGAAPRRIDATTWELPYRPYQLLSVLVR